MNPVAARSTATLTVGLALPEMPGLDLRQVLRTALADQPGIALADVSDGATPALPPEVLIAAPWQALPAAPDWFASVRWVHTVSAGVDNAPRWMLGAPVVTCSRGVHAPQISEWVLAALLSDARPDPWISGPPERRPLATTGRLLAGSTLGIVGLGEIGQAVGRRALALDMRVVATRRRERPSPVAGVRLAADLGELLEVSDAVVLSAAATEQTRHLLDDAAFDRVKPGVHLLNVARGSLVDHDALRRALDDGRVRAASLDVTDPEPLPAGHWLYRHPRARVSPHVSAWSPHLGRRLAERFLTNLDRFREGADLLGLVDPARGY